MTTMPARLFLSSGDLIADRRFEFARDLQLKGDLAAAADLLLQAVELAPGFASAWFTLGEIREQLGERDAAIAAFRKARDRRSRRSGMARGLRLMRLGAEANLGDAAGLCAGAVRSIRAAIRDRAGRRSRLSRAVAVVQGGAVGARRGEKARLLQARHRSRLRHGTGGGRLCQGGRSISSALICRRGMIEKAKATGLYAELEVDDMVEGLRGRPDASADLILAADAMVYVADLVPVLAEVSRVLAAGGLLAFTLERHAGDGVILGEGLRYAHSPRYVRSFARRRRPDAVATRGAVVAQRGATFRCPVWSWLRKT